jgi:hypothetical protein
MNAINTVNVYYLILRLKTNSSFMYLNIETKNEFKKLNCNVT